MRDREEETDCERQRRDRLRETEKRQTMRDREETDCERQRRRDRL